MPLKLSKLFKKKLQTTDQAAEADRCPTTDVTGQQKPIVTDDFHNVSAQTPQSSPKQRFGNVDISGAGASAHLGDIHNYYNSDSQKDELTKLLSSLSFPEIHTRFDSISDALEGTCEWILEPNTIIDDTFDSKQRALVVFSEWYFHGHDFFWISGKPGSGKSTLMKHLVYRTLSLKESRPNDTITQAQPRYPITLAYFFWLNGTPLQRNTAGCTRSLLCQLLNEPRTTAAAVSKLSPQLLDRYAWTDRRLISILCEIISGENASFIIFLDGLDECDDHEASLSMIGSLRRFTNVKICASSRPEAVFIGSLRDNPAIRLQDVNADDIEKLISVGFSNNPKVLDLASQSDDAESDLETTSRLISWKAEGVFLWVHLVIQDLLRGVANRDDMSTIKRRIEKMPRDMNQLYLAMLRRGSHDAEDYEAQAALYFSLLLCRSSSSRDHSCDLQMFSLATNDELRHYYLHPLLTIHQNRSPQPSIDKDIIITRIHARTAGLLHVTNRPQGLQENTFNIDVLSAYEVNFIHRTAADFVRHGEGQRLLAACGRSFEELAQMIYEANLISTVLLPCLRGSSAHHRDVIKLLAYSRPGVSYLNLRSDGLDIWKFLTSTKHIIPDPKLHLPPHMYGPFVPLVKWPRAFPSSRYAVLDFLPLLLCSGQLDIAEEWMDGFRCWEDVHYISYLIPPLICGFERVGQAGDRKVKCDSLWERFMKAGADELMPLTDGDNDIYYPLFEIPDIVLLGVPNLLFRSWPVNPDKEPLAQSRCQVCHHAWYIYREVGREVHYWGEFCLGDVIGSRQEQYSAASNLQIAFAKSKTSTARSRVRVAVIFDSRRLLKPVMRAVSKEDSDLRLSDWMRNAERIYNYTSWQSGYFRSSESILFLGNSPIISSFAAAMTILGKSNETVRSFYIREARKMESAKAKYREGWEEWFWGSDRPTDLGFDPIT